MWATQCSHVYANELIAHWRVRRCLCEHQDSRAEMRYYIRVKGVCACVCLQISIRCSCTCLPSHENYVGTRVWCDITVVSACIYEQEFRIIQSVSICHWASGSGPQTQTRIHRTQHRIQILQFCIINYPPPTVVVQRLWLFNVLVYIVRKYVDNIIENKCENYEKTEINSCT